MSYRWDTICNGRTDWRTDDAILICLPKFLQGHKKKSPLNYPKMCSYEIFSKGFKNEFKTALVNEPSVFEPLKVYCIKDTYKEKWEPLVFPLVIFSYEEGCIFTKMGIHIVTQLTGKSMEASTLNSSEVTIKYNLDVTVLRSCGHVVHPMGSSVLDTRPRCVVAWMP